MHNKLIQYLNSGNLTKLAELIAVNYGQIDIKRIGPVPNDSVWGREGLTPTEAFELTAGIQFCWGIMFGLGIDDHKELNEAIQNEITKREQKLSICIPTTEEINRVIKRKK